MANVTYNDATLPVRYLEAFLQTEYSSTLRVSGLYDEYTHDALIEYMHLPEVANVNDFYAVLIEEYSDLTKYFIVSRGVSHILYTSKDNNEETAQYMDEVRKTLYTFVRKYGWKVGQFLANEDTDSTWIINLVQEERKNLIPRSAISLINLSMPKYVFNAKLKAGSNAIDFANGSGYCINVSECKPNTTYYFTHNLALDPLYPDDPVEVIIASSNALESTDFENDGGVNILKIETLSVSPKEFVTYTTSEYASTILICMPYTEAYNNTILLLEKDTLPNTDNITFDSYWVVNSKFFDYLYCMAITEYSDEEDIMYAQLLFSKLENGKPVGTLGVYNEEFKKSVQEYQVEEKIPFALGYFDAQTEASIRMKVNE